MVRFKNQILLKDITSSTRYITPENDRYSITPTQWHLLNSNFREKNCGTKLLYDQIDTTHADMCFSNITIPHSV